MRTFATLVASLAVWVGACARDDARPRDVALIDLALDSVDPAMVLPGTVLVVSGDSFVDDPWGTSWLRLEGTHDGTAVDVQLPLEFVDYTSMQAEIDGATFAALGGEGELSGTAHVEVRSTVDEQIYRSAPVNVTLSLRDELAPTLDVLQVTGVIFPNEPIALGGDGLLLPGEGESVAVVDGCFTVAGDPECQPISPQELPIAPTSEFDRTEGSFPFAPRIAGILPGRFEGAVTVRNHHAGGNVVDGPRTEVVWDLEAPIVYGASTTEASLGQHVTLAGAGFVGAGEGDTLLAFTGEFTADASGASMPVDVVLLPEFVDGHAVRYVVNEDDQIGLLLDVRFDTGVFAGTLVPTIAYGEQEVMGDPTPLQFRLLAVRQVVHVIFLPSYVESLRLFGLRAVDQRIRARVLDVVRRDYTTLNLEVRDAVPDDFALYAQVEIGGPDLNGLGLLGYDNTPGKDTENERLYDKIGGVNAQTQQDGYPGYGGVFIESLFGYSEHPGDIADPLITDPRFDALFDPFRPDRDGDPVDADDLSLDVTTLGNGDDCPTPGDDRRTRIACAAWALGSMIGTTVSHEIGHSLGLADPYGPLFHNDGEQPDRLMDADRPFGERAEIEGEGPSRFCSDEYAYLRAILPSTEPEDPSPRPACF